jgi:hypothetical protein
MRLSADARHERAGRRRTVLIGVAAAVLAIACGDPYRHTNPYDPAFPVAVSVTGPDTLYNQGDIAQFGATSAPVFPDSSFTFGTNDSLSFTPAGPSAFVSHNPPLYPTVHLVEVIAGIGAIDTFVPMAQPGPAQRQIFFRHTGFLLVALTQRVVSISLRCPVTHACDTLSVGDTTSVWVDGRDAHNQQIVALTSSSANPATGTPIATYAARDPTVVSLTPVGIRATIVRALKTGTTWIVGTRGSLLDSLQLVVR